MLHKRMIELKPIGFVKTNSIKNDIKGKNRISEIIICKEWTKALDGIQDFSHLFIIFWMHKISNKDRIKMKVHPRGIQNTPLLGIFATRTPYRPNPIGLTLVELLKVKDNVLTIRGLDAITSTPILDLKPFDYWDMAEDVRIPEWWMKLEKD